MKKAGKTEESSTVSIHLVLLCYWFLSNNCGSPYCNCFGTSGANGGWALVVGLFYGVELKAGHGNSCGSCLMTYV